jgi:hypothetical protein
MQLDMCMLGVYLCMYLHVCVYMIDVYFVAKQNYRIVKRVCITTLPSQKILTFYNIFNYIIRLSSWYANKVQHFCFSMLLPGENLALY